MEPRDFSVQVPQGKSMKNAGDRMRHHVSCLLKYRGGIKGQRVVLGS